MDEWDRRCLSTLLYKYLNEESLKDGFVFYDQNYVHPGEGTLTVYKQVLEEFPTVESPDLFVLHLNSQISIQNSSANSIIDCILQIQPKEMQFKDDKLQSIIGIYPDETLAEVCTQYLNRLPA